MKSKSLIILSLVVIAAVLFFVVRQNRENPTKPGSALEKVSLRLQWIPQAQFVGFYVAQDKGFYRNEGLDVTINSGGQDFNAVTLVASGSDDFGIWTGDQVMLAASKSIPIKAVGKVFNRSLAAFMVKKESGIKSIKDFEGKTVGIYAGYDTETLYLYLLKKYNVDRTKIKETALQYDLGRFFKGEVDVWPAYAINQPLAAKENGVAVDLITPDQFGIKYYSDTIIVSNKTLTQRRGVVERFLKASQSGWEYALAHPDEAINLLLARDPHLKRDHETDMLKVIGSYMDAGPQMLAMKPADWESIAAILEADGLLKTKINLSDVADFSVIGK